MQSTITTNRRALLGTLALAPLAALPVAAHAAEGGGDDAELIAACGAFMALQERLDAGETHDDAGNPGYLTDEERGDLIDRQYEALERLTAIRPSTPRGLRAKVEAAYVALAPFAEDDGREEEAALAVLADLMAMGRA